MAPKDHYYTILGVDKKADDAAIKSAYKKAALKHHPDRNPNKQDEARKKFQEISEAFEVLSDPNKRTVYDQFGEEGLKGRPPPPGAGGSGPSGFSSGGHGMGGFPGGGSTFFTTSTGGAPGGAGFTPTDPEQIFRTFFASSGDGGGGLGGLFSGMGGGGLGGMGGGGRGAGGAGRRPPSGFGFGGMDVDDDSEEDIRGMRGGMPGGFGMNGGGKARAGPSASAAPPETVKPHPFALEDLYKGGTKKLKVMRKKANGRDEPVIVEVPLKPGWKAGTKIRFPNQGNEDGSGRAATLCIEVQQKPHPKFTRDGDDLVYVYKLSLSEALTGADPSTSSSSPSTSRTIDTLDGRKLSFPIAFPTPTRGGQPVQPGQVLKRFIGEGMPISRKGAAKPKGDLIVKAEVALPDRVTGQQVEAFKRLLGGGSS